MSKARGPYRVDPLGYKKSQQALDKKAENARALGLDYEPAQQEPVAFLANGTRFKMAFFESDEDGAGNTGTYVTCFNSFEKELDGRWVALVSAEDDCHLKLTPPAQQEPVAWKWQPAPIRTAWGDEMVVASVAIDKDHTLSLYCERDQAPKVEAMFAQRTWVGLTDEDLYKVFPAIATYTEANKGLYRSIARAIEAKLKEKNT